MNLLKSAQIILYAGLLGSAVMATPVSMVETTGLKTEHHDLVVVGANVPTMETGGLTTRWTATVTSTNVHPEYPRPQLLRERWKNLNGLWDYAITLKSWPAPEKFDGQILVPFPVESYLSGVKRRLDEDSTLWYRRSFTVPTDWRGQSVELNFGAVSWKAKVFLNGHEIGSHQGDYDAFSFDLTPALQWDGKNELLIAVQNPIEGDHPHGKQSGKPEGIFYSASSGIWQTVWLEPVPPAHLTALRFTPELVAGDVRVFPMANTIATDCVVEAVIFFDGNEVGRATGAVGTSMTVDLKILRPWSPANPDLYDVAVKLRQGTQTLDEVKSYFGLREIHVGSDEHGLQRLVLNGQPLFELGVMDQGFWPDGLYTAPSDAAILSDLTTVKRLGFNLVRKHVKVEPERWYYWADKLGLLVWQDMPSANNATEAGRQAFQMELEQMLWQRGNHPSIVMWILFNEGWGQFDTEQLTRWVKAVDPTRLVDNASGWADTKVGDVIDIHSYPEPPQLSFEGSRAGVLGEFGGLGLGVLGHTWSPQIWGYQLMSDSQELTTHYLDIIAHIWKLESVNGLAAAVFTQLTDVESECNGLLTYDRAVLKIDAAKVYEANIHAPPVIAKTVLLPNAIQGDYAWRYTTNTPPKDWQQPEFDDSAWEAGPGGFGTPGTPGAIVKTEWKTDDIWLRRQFNLAKAPTQPLNLIIHHDEDVEVYLNGVLAARLPAYSTEYINVSIFSEAQLALHAGQNLIAVHCHQTVGGQYIDVGILEQVLSH